MKEEKKHLPKNKEGLRQPALNEYGEQRKKKKSAFESIMVLEKQNNQSAACKRNNGGPREHEVAVLEKMLRGPHDRSPTLPFDCTVQQQTSPLRALLVGDAAPDPAPTALLPSPLYVIAPFRPSPHHSTSPVFPAPFGDPLGEADRGEAALRCSGDPPRPPPVTGVRGGELGGRVGGE